MVELKEGAYYKMRNGGIIGPILRGSPYAAFCFQTDGAQLSWTRTGYYWYNGYESEFDLVELVSEPIRPNSGGYYRMRNDEIVGPVHWAPFIDTTRPYAAARGDKFALRWTEKGNQWLSGFPGEFDLVEEVSGPFKLEEGKYYKSRDGRIFGPMWSTATEKVFTAVSKTGWLTWAEDGSACVDDAESHALNLVEEVPAPCGPEVGKYYKSRDGQIFGPLRRGGSLPFVYGHYGWLLNGQNSKLNAALDLVEEVKGHVYTLRVNGVEVLCASGIPKRPPEPEPEPERLFYVPVSGYVGVFADSAEEALKIAGDVLDEMLDENDLVEISGPPVEN